MMFRVHVRVIPRAGLLDPQGQAIEHALGALNFAGVTEVRVGKAIELSIEAESASAAKSAVRQMCERLLASPVMEDFTVEVTS